MCSGEHTSRGGENSGAQFQGLPPTAKQGTQSECRPASGGPHEGLGQKQRREGRPGSKRGHEAFCARAAALTTRGQRVPEHLVELGQVHHHGQLVRLPD